MSKFLETRGNSVLTIAICDRCKMKRAYDDIEYDRNIPGLRVCKFGCNDERDPYRLPARQPEKISVRFPRPDAPLTDLTQPAYPYGGLVDGYIPDPGFGD